MTQAIAPQLAPPEGVAVSRSAQRRIGTPMRPLAHSFSWTLVGMLTYGACQWGMLVVLAQLGNPALVGQFALALAITAPILLLAGMSLRTVQATDHAEDYAFGDYLGLQTISIALAMAAVVVIALTSGRPLATQGAILLVGLAKAMELVSDLLFGLLQRHDRMDRIGKSLILKGLVSLSAVAVGVYFTGSAVGAAAGLAMSWGLLLAVYDVRNGRQTMRMTAGARAVLAPRWNARKLRSLAGLALPMGLTTMLGAVIANLPRYFVETYLGDHELGIFAALAYFTIAGHLVAGALAQAALPRLSRFYATGQVLRFRRLLVQLLCAGAALGITGILLTVLFGQPVLELLYGNEYARRADVFLVLMLSLLGAFPIFFLDYALFAARRFRVLTPINAVVAVLTAIASWECIPRFGLLGAAWVTCLVMAVQGVLRGIVVWRVIQGMAQPKLDESPAESTGYITALLDQRDA